MPKTKDAMSVKEYTEAQYKRLSEADHQADFIAWCDENPENLPGLEMLYNIPNGGGGKIRGAQLKRTGLRAGMPDLCLPVSYCTQRVRQLESGGFDAYYLGHIGLFIEMKKIGRYATPDQKAKHNQLRALGHAVEVCQGSDAAKIVVRKYYAGTLGSN